MSFLDHEGCQGDGAGRDRGSACGDRGRGGDARHPLLLDCLDAATGEVHPVTIVSDNGPTFKSTDFQRFIRSRPELAHVRTRHHAPETNGVVERFNGSLKYEHVYREEIADAAVLTEEVERFREIYNRVRPHEALGFLTDGDPPPNPTYPRLGSVQET